MGISFTPAAAKLDSKQFTVQKSELPQLTIKLLFDVKSQSGTSLILVTHDRALAQRCDRMAEVLDGKIVSGAMP
jgi:predicted ABC-type transport system involved in lysophospholipase L1 biosynthesis ATPase subunit